jgi:DNA-binding transcriptional regulator YdaS (Cro superfamily)
LDFSRSSPLIAEMLKGISWTDCARRVAVTTISSKVALLLAVSSADHTGMASPPIANATAAATVIGRITRGFDISRYLVDFRMTDIPEATIVEAQVVVPVGRQRMVQCVASALQRIA